MRPFGPTAAPDFPTGALHQSSQLRLPLTPALSRGSRGEREIGFQPGRLMSAAGSGSKPVKTRLWQISLTVPVEAEEAVAALFESLFRGPASVYTDAERPTAAVSAYCPKLPRPESDVRARLRTGLKQIQSCGLDIGAARIAIRKLRSEAWADSWKKHFQPLEIGRA